MSSLRLVDVDRGGGMGGGKYELWVGNRAEGGAIGGASGVIARIGIVGYGRVARGSGRGGATHVKDCCCCGTPCADMGMDVAAGGDKGKLRWLVLVGIPLCSVGVVKRVQGVGGACRCRGPMRGA